PFPTRRSSDLSTPGVIYQDLLILGGLMSEDLPSPPGDIRAYDVRTGKMRWSFHTIPHPGEFGYDTWPKDAWKYSGSANNWAGMAVDEKRGLVFAPTGSAAFDFYASNRIGDDLFANSLIALNAATGQAAGLCAVDVLLGDVVASHARCPRGRSGAVQENPQRRPVRASEFRRHGRFSGIRWRRRVGRRSVRSANQAPVRERE